MSAASELPDDWRDKLRECDLERVAEFFRESFRISEAEAKAKGGANYYEPNFMKAMSAFMMSPNISTATSLLEVAPRQSIWQPFEMYGPDGFWTMLDPG